MGLSNFKYTNKRVFVDAKRTIHDVWELLTQSRPDKKLVTYQDKQTYKQILLSLTHIE